MASAVHQASRQRTGDRSPTVRVRAESGVLAGVAPGSGSRGIPAGKAGAVAGGFGLALAAAVVAALAAADVGSGVWLAAGVTLNCGAAGAVMVTVVRGAETVL